MTQHAPSKSVAIIGAGPAGLIAAEKLSASGHQVAVYERMPSVGRKFLMAGRGGLNLTHSEDIARFLPRYGEAADWLVPQIAALGPAALRLWAEGLGQETFVGSSGRVFPRAMKASPLLRAWLSRLAGQGVTFYLRHDWQGWDEAGALRFATPNGTITETPDATLLALGGASWPKLGADGGWVPLLAGKGIAVTPLTPANMGVTCAWSAILAERHAGEPVKNVAIRIGAARARGEMIVTRQGLEGGVIYALSAAIREALAQGEATLVADLKPDQTPLDLVSRLVVSRKGDTLANRLRKGAGLAPVAIALLHEHASRHGKKLAEFSPDELTALIKALPLPLTGASGMARAISTAGGIARDELTADLMLAKLPGVFAAGEMLDWDAPTGGYLLQACFATGAAAARGIERYLSEHG
jgi:uncharacterized flavoprotein (TIGR03862 family)